MDIVDFSVRIASALMLGSIIGAERQWRQHVAGMKTNALVAMGAALFVALSDLTLHDASPTRIAAQVVSGVGFLGAGLLMRDEFSVKGLNTAATLWCAAAIGVLCGSGHVKYAAAGTIILLLAQVSLFYFAQKLHWRNSLGEPIEMSATLSWHHVGDVSSEVRKKWMRFLREDVGVRIQSVKVKKNSTGMILTVQVALWKTSTEELDDWVQKMESSFGGRVDWETI